MHKIVNLKQTRLFDPFDNVLTEKTLPNIHRKNIAKELHRILNPNGVLIISFNNCMSLYDPYYLKPRFIDSPEVPNTGPFEPMSFKQTKNILKNFQIEEI